MFFSIDLGEAIFLHDGNARKDRYTEVEYIDKE